MDFTVNFADLKFVLNKSHSLNEITAFEVNS